jgi:iron(III) transport system substrate-binding protein
LPIVIRTFSAIVCLAAAFALSALAFTGCGGSEDTAESAHSLEDVLAAVDGLSGAKRTAELERLAAEEGGELTLYTSTSEYMPDVADAFEDEHDVGVAIYEASSESLVQRMIEEKAAGYRGSDVVEASTPNLVPLIDEGILAQYESPKLAGLAPESLGESWIADKLNTFVAAWNTDRVPKGQEPHSYEDLADPRWKGKLALEADDSDWYKELWEHLVETGKTPAEADRIFAGVARNATFVNGHTLMTQLVASGEFDITLNAYLHAVEELRREGAPLAWEPAVKPLISRPDGIAVVQDARHPAAALLFVDFLLDQGQEIFADAGLTVTRKDLGVPESVSQIAMDVPDYVANAEEWTQRYEDLVRMGKVAPDTG